MAEILFITEMVFVYLNIWLKPQKRAPKTRVRIRIAARKTNGIHKGESTQIQGHVMTCSSLRVMKTMARIPQNPILLDELLLLIVLFCLKRVAWRLIGIVFGVRRVDTNHKA